MEVYDNSTDSISTVNPYTYRGYRYDSELMLYYLNSRYYNPVSGRFINSDGLLGSQGNILGHNMYAYTQNNPVMYTDISGYAPEWLKKAAVIIGVILVVAAVTILTCGVGTGTLIGAIAVGAAKGALIGAAVGIAAGAGIGYAINGKEGAIEGAMLGFGAGALVGAAVGGYLGASSWYATQAANFTVNPMSNEVVLGRSGVYEQVANSRGATHFFSPKWQATKDMFGVGSRGMWRINKIFLDAQIAAGKTFILASPTSAGGYFYQKELKYLIEQGILRP